MTGLTVPNVSLREKATEILTLSAVLLGQGRGGYQGGGAPPPTGRGCARWASMNSSTVAFHSTGFSRNVA